MKLFLFVVYKAISAIKNLATQPAQLNVNMKGEFEGDKVVFFEFDGNIDMDNYIYTIFCFAWDKISIKNRLILFDKFFVISGYMIAENLSVEAEIEIPNHLVEKADFN